MSDKKELKTFMDLYANKNQNTGVHSEIDNQLLSSSLNRILHADDMFGTTALYEAFTRGGEKRHIRIDEPAFGNMATPENLEWMEQPGIIDKLLNFIRRDNSGTGGGNRNERLKKEDHYR